MYFENKLDKLKLMEVVSVLALRAADLAALNNTEQSKDCTMIYFMQ